MGQAKRRRAVLGDLYGTGEGSNAPSPLQLREMDPREIEGAGLTDLAADLITDSSVLLMAVAGPEQCFVVAKPTIDAAGQFNSHVVAFSPKGASFSILQGRRKTADHRAINRYLLDRSDVVITA